MDDETILQTIADRLDGLLDGAQAEEADRLIASRPELHERAQRMRALLYAPWSVGAPPRARIAGRVLRYAAAFAAGALLTLLLQARPERPAPETRVEPGTAPVAVPVPVLVVENRRIT